MHRYQKEFIQFLMQSDALQFGEFTLKSGRVSPYFVNTGKFDTGQTISRLGYFYAAALTQEFEEFDSIFGPSYKGVPLAVTAAISLARDFQILRAGYTFDRKEKKEHGDKGPTVGKKLTDGDRIVLVDDVFTTGQTKYEAVDLLRGIADVQIVGLLIAVDRREKGKEGENAIAEFEKDSGVPIRSIVSIHDILELLKKDGKTDSADAIQQYLDQYGVA